jgi:lycopene beta-cyclase
MAVRDYEAIFAGGLAAMLLLRELGAALSGRVAVVDPCPPPERPTVHWSYWSHGPTLYDRFSVASWQNARVAQMPAESVAPYTLHLVRSTDVFAHIAEELRTAPIEWLHASAHSVERREDGTHEVGTDAGAVRTGWVFDSVPDIEPAFPSPLRPRAVLSGTSVRVTADRPVFDAAIATLFDPLDERFFAYLLPLSPARVGNLRLGHPGRRPNAAAKVPARPVSGGRLRGHSRGTRAHTARVRAFANRRP